MMLRSECSSLPVRLATGLYEVLLDSSFDGLAGVASKT